MAEILNIRDLRVHFHEAAPDRFAVDGLSLSMQEGEIVGLVGESGSGKTVTAMSIGGLLPRDAADTSGSITLNGNEIFRCSEAELLDILGEELGIVFQEPMTSMNPVLRIGPQVEECLRVHTKLSKEERRRRALEAMEQAELADPASLYDKFLLADEPTTALDVTIQAQILELLKKLNREHGMAILLISHNLHVVRKLCSRVAVMQRGRLVEEGPVEEIFRNPKHEYTKRLIAAIPTRDKKLI